MAPRDISNVLKTRQEIVIYNGENEIQEEMNGEENDSTMQESDISLESVSSSTSNGSTNVITDVFWTETPKSRYSPGEVNRDRIRRRLFEQSDTDPTDSE